MICNTRCVSASHCRLGLGGPIVPEAKQPPAYKLAMLPARDSVRWRFTVRITGFGRTSVQPFVSLPVEVPLEAGTASGALSRTKPTIFVLCRSI